MKLHFYKYQGAGNDFIIIDERDTFPISSHDKMNELVEFLCDRRFGIGADGLILLQNHSGYDFRMVYFNSDGQEGTMCGNGGRCLVAFAAFKNIIEKHANFLAIDGSHKARIVSSENHDSIVSLEMRDVTEITPFEEGYLLDTGSPHYVVFKNEIQDIDLHTLGRTWRNKEEFGKGGVNFNIARKENNHIFVRTYERGVEEETLACGTGITATAIALHYMENHTGNQRFELKAKGGDMQVSFHNPQPGVYTHVYLQGPAQQVFEGVIEI
ncbi:MAG: diaminopimelate epimerase [Bacteroidota bacterium]